jgi:phosphomannomutase
LNSEPIISVSGLRGIVGQTLTPEVAIRYACAFAAQIGDGPILLTRDGRATGRMLADAVRAGLCAVGRDVVDADIAATPTTGVLVRSLQAAGGIQVSASHNPPEYNGLKLFAADGRVISEASGRPVLELYRSGNWPTWVDHRQIGQLRSCDDTLSRHATLVLATVDVATIRARRFHVLLDANHGAGSLLGQRLLNELGCELQLCGTPADGQFEHTPEPTAENLTGICSAVRHGQLDVGFCQDPDADRLALIDESGRYLGEEFTLALAVQHVLSQTKGPIVTNCSTSRMSQDLAQQHGVPFFYSKVGEANVTALMLEKRAVFGGEGNGGPIDPRVGYVRDSFVGMALVLDAMASTGKPVSRLAAELPQYAICKTKIPVEPSRLDEGFARLEECFADATYSRLDGLRLDWPDRWLLVRASNTEPIVRLIAEAKQLNDAQQLCRQAASALGVSVAQFAG